MKIVKASNGPHFFIVDDEDFERVSAHNWTKTPDGYFIGHPYGAYAKSVLLHRFILNYDGPLDIDHVNRWTWDNQKLNLRITTRTINNLNRISCLVKERKLVSGKSVFDARIQVYGKSIHLGTFTTYLRAKTLSERARRDVIAGESNVISIKREHRFAKVTRKAIKLEAASLR